MIKLSKPISLIKFNTINNKDELDINSKIELTDNEFDYSLLDIKKKSNKDINYNDYIMINNLINHIKFNSISTNEKYYLYYYKTSYEDLVTKQYQKALISSIKCFDYSFDVDTKRLSMEKSHSIFRKIYSSIDLSNPPKIMPTIFKDYCSYILSNYDKDIIHINDIKTPLLELSIRFDFNLLNIDIEKKEKLFNDFEDLNKFFLHYPLLNSKFGKDIFKGAIITDVKTERFMRKSINQLLSEIDKNGFAYFKDKDLTLFLVYLSYYCYRIGYIWTANDINKDILIKIENFINSIKDNKSLLDYKFLLVVFSLFKDISLIPKLKKRILELYQSDDDLMNSFIEINILDFDKLANNRKDIKKITNITNSISLKVKQQYFDKPYPLWGYLPPVSDNINSLDYYDQLSQNTALKPYISNSKKILIAGCGTGQHPLQLARVNPSKKFVAIDLSESSLSYAMNKAVEYNITNVEFLLADILELDNWDMEFDLIETIGVLHHLENPLDGLKSLLSLLSKDGLIKIGLYSDSARQNLNSHRKFIKENNFDKSSEDIIAYREMIIDLLFKDGFEKYNDICVYQDFYSLPELRDLLFHECEHNFTQIDLKNFIKEGNMKFLCMYPNLNAKTALLLNQYRTETNDIYLEDLDKIMRFEKINPSLFYGMYNFYCTNLN